MGSLSLNCQVLSLETKQPTRVTSSLPCSVSKVPEPWCDALLWAWECSTQEAHSRWVYSRDRYRYGTITVWEEAEIICHLCLAFRGPENRVVAFLVVSLFVVLFFVSRSKNSNQCPLWWAHNFCSFCIRCVTKMFLQHPYVPKSSSVIAIEIPEPTSKIPLLKCISVLFIIVNIKNSTSSWFSLE